MRSAKMESCACAALSTSSRAAPSACLNCARRSAIALSPLPIIHSGRLMDGRSLQICKLLPSIKRPEWMIGRGDNAMAERRAQFKHALGAARDDVDNAAHAQLSIFAERMNGEWARRIEQLFNGGPLA